MNKKENQDAEVAEGQRECPTLENSSAFPGITVLQFVAMVTDHSKLSVSSSCTTAGSGHEASFAVTGAQHLGQPGVSVQWDWRVLPPRCSPVDTRCPAFRPEELQAQPQAHRPFVFLLP